MKTIEAYSGLFGIFSLFLAALGLSGMIYPLDITGRIIWCSMWSLIGWFWLSKKINPIRQSRSERHEAT